MVKIKYYSGSKIRSKNATWNIVFGMRSNGKTYDTLKYGIEKYKKNGNAIAHIRRWDKEIAPKNIANMLDGLIANGILKGTGYDCTLYRAGRWYLANNIDGKIVPDKNKIFMYSFSIQSQATYKGGYDIPELKTFIFDEFLSRDGYMTNEFVELCNLIKTLCRNKSDIEIYMLGNTVNFSSPYWDEMGLKNVRKQKQGTIDVYKYGNSSMTVAVEYAEPIKAITKISQDLFAFDNPRLNMITTGAWELDNYPHLPIRLGETQLIENDIFVEYEGDRLQLEFRYHDSYGPFLLIHMFPATPRNAKRVYSPEMHFDKHYKVILETRDKVSCKIMEFIRNHRVYYGTNTDGEIFRNWLMTQGYKI